MLVRCTQQATWNLIAQASQPLHTEASKEGLQSIAQELLSRTINASVTASLEVKGEVCS